MVDKEDFEVVFVEGIEEDFIKYKIKEGEVIKIKQLFSLNLEHILKISNFVKGIKYKVRKYRILGKFRLFYYVKDYTIYCLAFLHRKECYKKENINKILTLVRDINKK